MPAFDKEEYWRKRREEKEFRELFWEWRAECKNRYGWPFVKSNIHLFTQRAFREYLKMYENLEEAREAMLKPDEAADLPGGSDEPNQLETNPSNEVDIKTTVDTTE